MKIGGLLKLTLLDYPEKVACTVFTVGCNLRCPFCHNGGMVFGTNCEDISEWELLNFLRKRQGKLEGMCLTGGEPLLQPDVENFLRNVKSLGYCVKLDTNGTFPDKLQRLVQQNLVDYVAMDVKNSQEAYRRTVGAEVDMDAIRRSVELLKSGIVEYEFRTTATGNFHTEQTMEDLGKWLTGASKLYLQKFVASEDMIDKTTFGCDEQTLSRYRDVLQKYVPNTFLRGC